MKKLAITGGKGGTGKSAIAVLMARDFAGEGKKVVLCDCDVECPNDYLLTGSKIGELEERVYAEFPKLIKKKCKKCGICAKTCRSNAIFQAPGKYPVFVKELCSGCGACWNVCPFGAIKPEKEEIGKIYLNKVGFEGFYLITGMAKPGLEETGPVVRKAKEFALDFAGKIKADLILFDTAAGLHCPVINALLGVDSAWAVTEPTPIGAYDLELMLALCRKIRVPVKIIINQADLGNRMPIEKVARKYKTEIEKEIPYSKKLAAAYSRGRLMDINLLWSN